MPTVELSGVAGVEVMQSCRQVGLRRLQKQVKGDCPSVPRQSRVNRIKNDVVEQLVQLLTISVIADDYSSLPATQGHMIVTIIHFNSK